MCRLWITGPCELYSDQLHVGQPVLIELQAFPRRQFKGEIEGIGGATETMSGQQETRPWSVQQVPLKVKFSTDGAGAARDERPDVGRRQEAVLSVAERSDGGTRQDTR